MSAGWGIPPYGEGDFGGLNTVVPDGGAVSLAGIAPNLFSEFFITPPVGAIAVAGSQPVSASFVEVSTGTVSISGSAPQLLSEVFVTPATNDAVIAGAAPEIVRADVTLITPPTGSVSVGNGWGFGGWGELSWGEGGSAPIIVNSTGFIVPAGSISIAGAAPTPVTGIIIEPGAFWSNLGFAPNPGRIVGK